MEDKSTKKYCLDKWSKGSELDEKLISFSNSFDNWISQFPDENKDVVLVLIRNMEYYLRTDVNKWLENLHSQLLECKDVTDDNTIYTFIKSDDGISNSSNDYWTNYKLINDVNSTLCYENVDAIQEEQWKYISNIVYIDDFSGTGNSFINELKKHESLYKNKNVYFIVINIMTKAMEDINNYGKVHNINITFLNIFNQKKVFEREIFEDNEAAKKQVKSLSKLMSIPKNFIMGYNKSEALVAYYNNTPNNTLGLIHFDTEKYKSIFPRNKPKRPRWQEMKRKEKSRKVANYNNKKR